MKEKSLNSPLTFMLRRLKELPLQNELEVYENWWAATGDDISAAIDRAGTPWLKQFDRNGRRVDEIQYDSGYHGLLQSGYHAGIVAHAFTQNDLNSFFQLGYITAFYDPGIYCPYTVSLATAHTIHKYASQELQQRCMPELLKTDNSFSQGATWMTEIGGGSDLGNNVQTLATKSETDSWKLTGDKYFASNVGADFALVAARTEDAPAGTRGISLFLVPKERKSGEHNYHIRRLKNKIGTRSVPTGEVELRASEGWLIGNANQGIYLVMEILNISRVANSVASMALAQRAISEAATFASQRQVFGEPLIQQPLMQRQFRYRLSLLNTGFSLCWEAVELLNQVSHATPPYPQHYDLFRLVAHLAKYWTAEFAVQTSKWAMEVHGGIGVLEEFPIERLNREAMILAVWEGTSHRQMLDALKIIREWQAHELLFDHIAAYANNVTLKQMRHKIELLLKMPEAMQEERIEPIFRELALFTAKSLLKKP